MQHFSDNSNRSLNTRFFKLRDITDHEKWLSIQDSLAEVTGLAIITVDYKGVPVTSHSGRREFCAIMRNDPEAARHCQKCDSRGGLEAVRLNKPYTYLCHANVVDVAIPIIIDERYVGAVMAGEVLLPGAASEHKLEKIVSDSLLETRFANNQHLWECYQKLPVYTMEKIVMMTRTIETITKYIVEEAMVKNALYELNRQLLAEEGDDVDIEHEDSSHRLGNIKRQALMVMEKGTGSRDNVVIHSPLVSNALQYVGENIGKSITLQEVAQFCHVSKSYFSRLFKKETGEAFSDYVSRMKVRQAVEMLVTTNKPVDEISNALGFSDCGYFIKRFKKYEGITPAVYRKFMRQNAVEPPDMSQEPPPPDKSDIA